MTWGNIISDAALTILSVVVTTGIAAGAVLLMTKAKVNWKTRSVSMILSVIVTLACMFFLQNKSLFFRTNPGDFNTIKQYSQLFSSDNKQTGRQEKFLDSNFIFINTATNYIARLEKGVVGDSTYNILVDLEKLENVLQYLVTKQGSLDLVVCDIIFSASYPVDTLINQHFRKMEKKGKLVLAMNNRNMLEKNLLVYRGLDLSSFGATAYPVDDPVYTTHNLIGAEERPSLPYLMYLKLAGIGSIKVSPQTGKITEAGKRNELVLKGYYTDQLFVNEDWLFSDRRGKSKTKETPTGLPDTIISPGLTNFYNLGYASTEDGQAEISALLNQKGKRHRNIVFIGSFSGKVRDVHPTPYGNLRGTTILINDFHHLLNNSYKMSWGRTIVYAGLLWTAFVGIFYCMISLAVKSRKDELNNPGPHNDTMMAASKKAIINFAKESIPYISLFLLTVTVSWLFGRLLNLMALVFYLLTFNVLFSFFLKYRWNKN